MSLFRKLLGNTPENGPSKGLGATTPPGLQAMGPHLQRKFAKGVQYNSMSCRPNLQKLPKTTVVSFQSHRLLFSHASAEVRGENTPERKVHLDRGLNLQPPGHESDTLTTEPSRRG